VELGCIVVAEYRDRGGIGEDDPAVEVDDPDRLKDGVKDLGPQGVSGAHGVTSTA